MRTGRLSRPTLLIVGLAVWLLSGPALAGVNAIHHELTLRLDPAKRVLDVSNRMRVQGGGEVVFRLAQSLVITGMKIDGRAAAKNRRGDALHVDLGAEGQHEVIIDYKGGLSEMSESAGGFDGLPLLASPQGSYLAAGSAWHPIVRGVGASYRMTLILPDPQKAVVPGRLVEETSTADQYRAVFESEIPAEGIVLIAGPFSVKERRHNDITLRTYFQPGLEDLSPGYLDSTADYIDLYKQSIGDYPFSSFNIVSGPLPLGLGFPGMTYIGARVLRLPFIRFTSLGHEVLHNWWGNGVEIDYANGNWAEGLTTYMADYAYAKKRGEDKARRKRTDWLRDYAALPPRRDRPVRSFISRRHAAAQIIGYNKVAFIFHMLERKVGEKIFRQAIRSFWADYRFRTAGWNDIRQTFEQASGQDLGNFFSQWLERSGAPRLILSDVIQNDKTISFTLSQPELPYALNVPIRLVTRAGEKTFHAAIDGKASRIELPLSAAPVSIAVDPDFDIFRRLDATEAPPILRDTMLKGGTITVFAGDDAQIKQTAQQLAARLMDAPSHGEVDAGHNGPLLIIGSTPAVAQYLHEHSLPTTPTSLLARGSARVWATRRTDDTGALQPMLVVEANDNEALRSLLRPLPHYGRRGYLVFSGAKAVDTGVWPAQAGPLSVTFD